MPSYLPIGLGAGLVAAVLFASAVIGQTMLGLILMLIVPLPKFLAGLGWGWRAAAVAAVTATILVAAIANVKAGIVYGLSQGLPAAWLCYLAYLNRSTEDDSGQPITEWYPIGRLLAWSVGIAGALATVFLLLLGTSSEMLRTQLRKVVEMFRRQLEQVDAKGAAAMDVDGMTELMVNLMPVAFAGSALFGILVNLWLAARITRASGRLLRPWPDLAATFMPAGSGLALAAATALSLPASWTGLPEYPRLIAAGVASAIMMAYVLIGLAILHYTTRGKSWRAAALAGGYAALLVLNPWSSLAFVTAALTEPFAPWRRRPMGPPPAAQPPGNT